MDLSKCPDVMWNEETINDFFDVGVHDDKFILLSKMNKECKVCVKTPVGVTDQFILKNIEMQGTVPAPLKCAAQMDGLGWECYTEKKFLYNYKRSCFIPNLGMIDDTFLASSCGVQSVQLNALINTLVEGKKLYFNQTKCYVIHLGPNSEECPKLMVHILFKLRTQTLNVKMNFGNPEDKLCQVCKLFPETQSHLLQCSEQLQIAKLYSKVLEKSAI